MTVELTTLADLNTSSKLVFSLALAVTFTSLLPWRLAGISCIYYLVFPVFESVCVKTPRPQIVVCIKEDAPVLHLQRPPVISVSLCCFLRLSQEVLTGGLL